MVNPIQFKKRKETERALRFGYRLLRTLNCNEYADHWAVLFIQRLPSFARYRPPVNDFELNMPKQ